MINRFLLYRVRHGCLLTTVFGIVACVLLTGCDPSQNIAGPNTEIDSSATIEQSDTDFRVALNFLDNFHEYEPNAAIERILYHLQKWIDVKEPDPDWIADPMFRQLPKRFEGMQGKSFLSQLQFSPYDIIVLREAIWARDLALQIRQRPLGDVRLDRWLTSNADSLSGSELQDLEVASRICDWIVRNIQLDEVRTGENLPAPGAWFLPGESLLFGRGDWLLRSRIAVLMGRQVGVRFVMLAVEPDDGDPKPWCLAALVAKELYLFDMRLGLPIPRKDGLGIARLGDLLADPALLTKLADPGEEAYPIQATDLKRIVALVDAAPEYLSQRMKIVQSSWPDDEGLVLTTNPSPLRQELRECEGIGANVSLWTAPYDAYLFRQQNLNRNPVPENLAELDRQQRLLDGRISSSLAMARRMHFRGRYSNRNLDRGAKAYYLECRVPNAELNRLDRDDPSSVARLLLRLPGEEVNRRRASRELDRATRDLVDTLPFGNDLKRLERAAEEELPLDLQLLQELMQRLRAASQADETSQTILTGVYPRIARLLMKQKKNGNLPDTVEKNLEASYFGKPIEVLAQSNERDLSGVEQDVLVLFNAALAANEQQLAKDIIRGTSDTNDVNRRLFEVGLKTVEKCKQNASYWLGLIAFDEGQFQVAGNYFSKRILDLEASQWTSGATYNLARSYEQRGLLNEDEGMINKAMATYRQDTDSAQAPGNRIRANLLESHLLKKK